MHAPSLNPPTITLMGVALHRVDAAGACDVIFGSLERGTGGWVITPNLDIVRQLVASPGLRAMCAPASLMLADGMPLVWASRLQGTPLPERVAGADLIWPIAQRAERESRSIYFLGGSPGAADAAAQVLREKHPALRIAGTSCPPMGFEEDHAAYAKLLDDLARAAPDIVFVGLGCPKQERVIERARQRLPAAWFLGVGVTFSFVGGHIRRAPAWMRRTGLEWCHRMAMEPGRLWKRYILHGIPFALRLFAGAAWGRIAGQRRREAAA